MKNNVYILLNIFYGLFGLTTCQYILMNRKVNTLNTCDPNNALVEQFFNLIFTEFHNTPPVCVCVQMCLDRPTYCYPNGCLRKPTRIEPDDMTTAYPINLIQFDNRSASKSVMFLVDNDKEQTEQFEEPKSNSKSERRERTSPNDFIYHPNPFKELVFKYKKQPKLEMRYNLREKVKNSQSVKIKKDKLDMSKTRWPINKHFFRSKQIINGIKHYKKADDLQSTYFVSMFPEIEQSSNKVALNKKLLTKREDRGFNMDSLYVYKTDAANFSIEKLIDDLIINSLDDNNIDGTVETNESFITTTEGNDFEGNITDNNFTPNLNEENATVNIILINSTKKNVDNNMYTRDTNPARSNKTYLEEITIMSERIDKINNISIGLVKDVTGLSNLKNEIDSNYKNISVDKIKTQLDLHLDLKAYNNETMYTTTETNRISSEHTSKRWNAPVLKTNIKQKSKQRIVRKLHRKLN